MKRKKILVFLSAFVLLVMSVAGWYIFQSAETALATDIESEPIYVKGFKNITTSSFVDASGTQMQDGATYTSGTDGYTMRDLQGNAIESYDKTLVSLRLQFTKFSNETGALIRLAGSNKDTGIMVYPSPGGSVLRFVCTNGMESLEEGEKKTNLYVMGSDLAVDGNGTGYFLNEFTLQISFQYEDSNSDGANDTILMGVYINGIQCDKFYNGYNAQFAADEIKIDNCNMNSFGNYFVVAINESNKPLTISTVVPKNENLTALTWNDFAEDQVFPQSSDSATYLHKYELNSQDVTHMADTSLELKMTFGAADPNAGCLVYFGGYTTWHGIPLRVTPSGNLKILKLQGVKPGIFSKDVDFLPNISGVSCAPGNEFVLKLTTEYADYDGDGTDDDVQLGFYFGGELYNNQYLYAYNCKDDFGNWITIVTKAGSIEMKSVLGEPDKVIYNLDEHPYPLGEGDKWINDELTADTLISEPGTYEIAEGDQDNVVKNFVTYLTADANASGNVDVKDLVAALKLKSNEGTAVYDTPELLGADVTENKILDESDISAIRDILIDESEKISKVTFDFIGGDDVMPITGFYEPHFSRTVDGKVFPNHINDTVFETIKALGINLITCSVVDYSRQTDRAEQFMTLADSKGIGVFVNDSYITGRVGNSYVTAAKLRNQIAKYSSHPSFCGMFLADEPATSYYEQTSGQTYISKYGSLARTLQYDLGLRCYLNMFPLSNGATEDVLNNYERYLQEFCKTLRPKVLMWDKYPIIGPNNVVADTYFQNMSLIRKYAMEYNVPFWSYIQAGYQWPTSEKPRFDSVTPYYPTEGQFHWNVNTSLAFGAKGIQYFPLIQPIEFAKAGTEASKSWDFTRNGLIGADGLRTSEQKYVTLKGYQNVTTNGFVSSTWPTTQMTDKEHTASQTYTLKKDTVGNQISSYDKTLLSLKLKFESGGTEGATQLQVAGKTYQHGIQIYPDPSGNVLRIIFVQGMAGEKQVGFFVRAKDFVEDYDGYFFDNEFVFQMSIDYVDTDNNGADDSVTLGVYIDGNKCDLYSQNGGTLASDTIHNCDFRTFGTRFSVVYGGKTVAINSVKFENQWYYYAQSVNKQIAAIDEVLMNAKHLGVIASSSTVKKDMESVSCMLECDQINELSSVSGDAMIGCFDYKGKTAFYVVNYNMKSNQTITLHFDAAHDVRVIQDAQTSSDNTNKLQLNMTPGEGILVVIES